jgi:hypothetical protein
MEQKRTQSAAAAFASPDQKALNKQSRMSNTNPQLPTILNGDPKDHIEVVSGSQFVLHLLQVLVCRSQEGTSEPSHQGIKAYKEVFSTWRFTL